MLRWKLTEVCACDREDIGIGPVTQQKPYLYDIGVFQENQYEQTVNNEDFFIFLTNFN